VCNDSSMVPMLTPQQCRAARGWLGWSQTELALQSQVSISTIRDFEANKRKPIYNNLQSVAEALMRCGVTFLSCNNKPCGILVAELGED
jgi:predicted transcriptional regulator